jgi:hypothetical protein
MACGYEYDFEYDWSRSSSPPKKKRSFPKLKWLVPKHKLSLEIPNSKLFDGRSKISVPKFDDDNDNAETDDQDEDVYRF